MEKINGTAHFLKELYERKFYEESRPKNAYEKVIVFQKKIEHFKIEKKTVAKEVQSSSNVLLEEAENHSRHSTNYSSFRLKCSKFANIPQKGRCQPSTPSEFRIIFDKIQAEDTHSQNKIFYLQDYNKKLKFHSHRENTPTEPRSNKTDLYHFLQKRTASTTDRQARSPLHNRKINTAVRQQRDIVNKTPSKKVFIGGRDLQKAAEEYEKHFRELNKNSEEYQQQKGTFTSLTERKTRKKTNKKIYRKQKFNMTVNAKTEPKGMKNDDFVFNLELEPWKVDLDNY